VRTHPEALRRLGFECRKELRDPLIPAKRTYFVFGGHVGDQVWILVVQNPYQNDMAAVSLRGLQLSGEYHH